MRHHPRTNWGISGQVGGSLMWREAEVSRAVRLLNLVLLRPERFAILEGRSRSLSLGLQVGLAMIAPRDFAREYLTHQIRAQ